MRPGVANDRSVRNPPSSHRPPSGDTRDKSPSYPAGDPGRPGLDYLGRLDPFSRTPQE